MKKLKILPAVVALATFSSQTGRAQVCSTNDSLMALMNDSLMTYGPSVSPPTCDDNLELYYGEGQLTAVIPVNFFFLMPTDTTILHERFKKYNSATCDTIISFLNDSLNNLLVPTRPLPNPAPFISSPNVQFVKKSVQKIPASASPTDFQQNIVSADFTAMNIVYKIGACNNGFYAPTNDYIGMQTDDSCFDKGITDHGYLGLTLHEVVHNLGLWHTNQKSTGSAPLNVPNPIPTIFADPPVDDYWLEGSESWYHSRWDTTIGANNMMSYCQGCRQYLSPKQIYWIHRGLHRNPVLNRKISNSSYCDPLQTPMVVDTTQTWPDGYRATGDIHINSGVHLTVSGLLLMPTDSKITVEPGARLTLDNACVQPACVGRTWQGIEVWGTSPDQTINSGFCAAKGIIDVRQSRISDAEVGVCLGEKNPQGNFVSGNRGGIIFSDSSEYLNCIYGVRFAPSYYLKGPSTQLSYFKNDLFKVDASLHFDTSLVKPIAALDLNEVLNIRVQGCTFKDETFQTSTAIRCNKSGIKMYDYCSSISNGACVGVSKKNTIIGFRYGIHAVGHLGGNSPQLDNVLINGGGAYLLNANNARFTNCYFVIYGTGNSANPQYALYLDNCDGYKVENDTFFNVKTGSFKLHTVGVYVHNSGPAPNAIYNCHFHNLDLGIWTQGQNFDPSNGQGLVANCNDFTSYTRYGIGVQKSPYLTSPPSFFVKPAGISTSQGSTAFGNELQYVRNTYGMSCVNNQERKMYVDVGDISYQINHGSFGQNDALWHPHPQTNSSCSSSSEVALDIAQGQPQQPRAQYCPNNFVSPSISMVSLNGLLTEIRHDLDSMETEYNGRLDGGNTNDLLEHIAEEIMPEADLKNMLITKDFLSDTVLKAYIFSYPPSSYLKDVVVKNAPLRPWIWDLLMLHGGLTPSDLSACEDAQFVDTLSLKNKMTGHITFLRNVKGQLLHEKVRRFVDQGDSVAFDSLKVIYQLRELPNWRLRLIELLINAGETSSANFHLDSLVTEDSSMTKLGGLLSHVIEIVQDEGYLQELRANNDARDEMEEMADEEQTPHEGWAKQLLYEVFGVRFPELMLYPDTTGTGQRKKDVLTINDNESLDSWRIYPNPATGRITVKCEDADKAMRLVIADVAGKAVLERQCRGECQVNMDGLSNGIYFISLYDQTLRRFTGKVVLAKE